MIPGEYILSDDGDIEANVGLPTVELEVSNTGDRPIQIGSHYHFYETNEALAFDRDRTRGFRLNIPSGTAIRFEPGDTRMVELVRMDGSLEIYGFHGKINGPLESAE